MHQPDKQSHIFRSEALKAYQYQKKLVFPPYLSSRTLGVLWMLFVLVGLILGAFWSVEIKIAVPAYFSAEYPGAYQITLLDEGEIKVGQSIYRGEHKIGTVTQITSDSQGLAQIDETTFLSLNDPSFTVFTNRKLGAYLPLLGPLFQQ